MEKLARGEIMTPREYASINMDTAPTTKTRAEKLAEFFSLGCYIYILKDQEGFYRPSWTPADLEQGLECVEIFNDGKRLEMAF